MPVNTIVGLLELRENEVDEFDALLYFVEAKEPLAKQLLWMKDKRVTVRYWITKEQCTREQLRELLIMNTVLGSADVKFGHVYSEYIGYLWTDEDFRVGGHDLMREFEYHIGSWLYLEVDHDEPTQTVN